MGSKPLESKPRQTLLEQVNQQPIVSLKLSKVATVHLQMCDWAASTVVFVKYRDVEIR